MVIDTSALVAIIEGEPEAKRMVEAIEADAVRVVSAGSAVEAFVVAIRRRGTDGAADVRRLLNDMEIEISAILPEHVVVATEGFERYGHGRHPARLNFGDCFSYALAKASGHPLLFKGDDFAKTDVAVVELAGAVSP